MRTLFIAIAYAVAAIPLAAMGTPGIIAPAKVVAEVIDAGPLSISPETKDLIVEFETGGRAYYEARLQRPSWPGGASGVTVGIGYDCGYNTRAAILADWAELPVSAREALAGTAGVKGEAAKVRASAVRWVLVPWRDAEGVFVARSMPRFGGLVAGAFPGVKGKHGHVQGVMLSLGFNRGVSKTGSTRREMAAIDRHLHANRIPMIATEIRSMKRLWVGKGLDGLLRRREAEALLIERSLTP